MFSWFFFWETEDREKRIRASSQPEKEGDDEIICSFTVCHGVD